MRILVTGGAGFIGSHLCDELLKMDAEVVAVDNLFTGKMDNLTEALQNKKFQFVKGDVNDEKFVQKLFEKNKFDYVFHYAAVLGVKRVLENPFLVLDDVEGIKNILVNSKKNGVKKVVFASSSEAYGNMPFLPLKEDSGEELEYQTHSTSLYSLVKIMGERMMKAYNDLYGLPTCSLRFFNVFGPKQEGSAYGFVVGIFIKQVINNENPTIFGDGKQTRDLVYVKDNVRMAIKALFSSKVDGQVVNIGAGKETTILELADKLIKISGKSLKPTFLPERKYEIRYRCPDTKKMEELLGDKINSDLEDCLRKTYEFYL